MKKAARTSLSDEEKRLRVTGGDEWPFISIPCLLATRRIDRVKILNLEKFDLVVWWKMTK